MINSNDKSVGPSRSLSRIRNEAIREFHTGLFNFTNCEYTLIIYSLSREIGAFIAHQNVDKKQDIALCL